MKNILLLLFILSLSSCYVYKNTTKKDTDIQQLIKLEHRYKITTNEEKSYKVKAIKWEQDSLVSYINNNENRVLKLHPNQIKSVKNRVFSRGRSDALTFGTYTLIGTVLYFLLNK